MSGRKKVDDETLISSYKKTVATQAKKGKLGHTRPKSSWKQGYREINGRKIFFRSRWEYNYALYLELLKSSKQIKEWAFETTVFWFDGIKRGCVSYKPDFEVTKNDGSTYFIEIKGWMDNASKTKLKRMAKYHPEVELVLVDSSKYKEFSKLWSEKLKGWEH